MYSLVYGFMKQLLYVANKNQALLSSSTEVHKSVDAQMGQLVREFDEKELTEKFFQQSQWIKRLQVFIIS